jgi:hypothetical protein
MTAHVHRGSFHDRLADNSLLSCPEVDAVRAEFGDLTGSQIEVKLAERQGHLNEAHDELSRLISTAEAAERCGVAESTIRGWVRRKKLTPVEYRELYPGETRINQIDVHRANQASQAKAAAVARRPQPRFTDREEALNQLTAAVPACLEAGLTDIPLLVQQIIDSADLDQH